MDSVEEEQLGMCMYVYVRASEIGRYKGAAPLGDKRLKAICLSVNCPYPE